MINFKCECGKSYNVNDEMAGRTADCQQCGRKITVPSPKPPDESNPFIDASPAVKVPNTPTNTRHGATGPYGKVLASGNGKRNYDIIRGWVVGLLLAGFIMLMFSWSSIGFRHDDSSDWPADKRQELSTVVFCVGVVIASLVILYVAFNNRGLAKTEITVCENGITGIGLGRNYTINFALHGFQLTYDKITSVDTTGTAITIHASGALYKCYVANPSEIQRIIVNQQHNRPQ